MVNNNKIEIMKNIILNILILLLLSQFVYSQKLSLQTGHSAGITDLAFTPDGKYLVSSGEDSKVILWDMISSKQMNIFTGHTKTVNSIAVDPFKNLIASASDDNTVKIWEYPSGKLIMDYNFFEYPVKSVKFSPDGKQLACGSDSVYLINLNTNEFTKIGKFSRKGYNALDYSKDGKYLAFGGKKSRKIYVYNFNTGKISGRIHNHSNDLIFDDESKFLLSAGQRGNIKRAPVNGSLFRRSFNISTNGAWNSFNAIVYNNDYFIGANRDNLIYVFNRNNGARREILKAHDDEVLALAIEPKGRFLASAGKDRKILIWDLQKFALIKSMQGGANRINSISFSDNGKLMFIGYNDGSFRLWNLDQKGKVLFQKQNKLSLLEKYLKYKYSTDNAVDQINTSKLLVKVSLNQKDKYSDDYNTKEALIIWKLREGMKTNTLKISKNAEYESFLIKDTANILLFKSKGTHSQKYSYLNKQKLRGKEQIFDTRVFLKNVTSIDKDKKLKLKKAVKLFKIEGDLYYKSLNLAGNELIALINLKGFESQCQVWDLNSNRLITATNLDEKYNLGGFSTTGKYIYLVSESSRTIKIYRAENMTEVTEFSGTAPVCFSPDDKLISFTDDLRNIYLVDLLSKKRIFKTPSGHSSTISEIKFNIPYDYIATAGHDGLIRFIDLNNGEPLMSLAAFGEDDFIYISPENYYYSTKGAMDYIGFIENDRLYTFEQFDVKFNRPDIVLSKLKYSDPREIEAYKKAYTKRVQKMGFSLNDPDSAINFPEISILNQDEFPISTTNSEITLKLKAKDEEQNIDRINVWVNDVPVYGTTGLSVVDKNSKSVAVECPVNLSNGKNKIQVSSTNEKGYESLKETFSIIYDVKETKPDLYLITIGVSKYQNPAYNLEYAAKDAEDVANLFKTSKSKVFRKVHAIEVLNNDATQSNVLKLKSQLEKTNVDDVVILFFAGHGVLDSDMNYYLATTEINMDNLAGSALRYDFLEGLFDGIPARKKVIIIDACHSGEVDKEEEFTEVESDDDAMFVVVRDVNAAAGLEARAKITTQNSFELMKMMFADIRRGTGTTVISSAGGGEYAFETGEAKNGVFTYVLKNGLTSKKADANRDGQITISELRDYVSKTVSKITKGSQNPTYRRENLDYDFRIW